MTVSHDPISDLDVIAVGAHPDDVEIACGGTLARLVDLGYSVGIIDLTDGEPTPNSSSPEHRLEEAQAAAKILGVTVRKILDFPNRRLFDCFEARVALATEFRRYRPKLVIGFGDKTPMASPDHWQAMQITDAAIFYSRLTKWDEHFDGLPVHTISRQLYFRLAVEPDHLSGCLSHVTVDIESTLQRKLDAVMCYQTQFAHRPEIQDRITAAAQITGQSAGVKAGEVFAAPKSIAVDDLYKTIVPTDSGTPSKPV